MIDKIDMTILSILQDNGRTSNADIARAVGMAPSAVLERMRKLERKGIIQGFEAVLRPKDVGFTLTAFTFVRADEGVGSTDIGKALARVPGVLEARQRGARRLADQQARLRALDLRLRAAVEETQQLVELGGVLARSAKIEAAYGGNFSAALMQVSTDFAEVIAQIKRSLEVLGKERLVKD